MKRILIIDDERIFPSLEGDDVETFYARTSTRAIDLLTDYDDWAEVWFDHDLGSGDDAMKIYDWMRQSADTMSKPWCQRIRRAYVHSMNPVGAANLRSRIKDFGIPTRRVGLPEGHTVIKMCNNGGLRPQEWT